MGTAVASSVKPWLSNASITSPFARYALSALLERSPSDPIAAATGVLPGGSGSPLTPSQSATSPPVSSVSPGFCVVATATGGTYVCTWPTATAVTHTTAAGSPRIDVLCARVRDNEADSSGVTAFELLTVDGTPASSPVAPTVPAGYLPLWNCSVATNGTITYTDRRIWTTAGGGLRYCPSYDLSRAGSFVGQLRVQLNGQIDVWLGSAWSVLATPATWTQFTPVLYYAGSALGGGSGSVGTVNLGTDGTASAIGRFVQTGKRLDLSYVFRWAGTSAGVNSGTGALYTQLPPGLVARTAEEQHIHAKLFVQDYPHNSVAGSNWPANCLIPANSTYMYPGAVQSQTDNRMYYVRAATSAGAQNQGVPQIPGQITQGGVLAMTGSIEIQ